MYLKNLTRISCQITGNFLRPNRELNLANRENIAHRIKNQFQPAQTSTQREGTTTLWRNPVGCRRRASRPRSHAFTAAPMVSRPGCCCNLPRQLTTRRGASLPLGPSHRYMELSSRIWMMVIGGSFRCRFQRRQPGTRRCRSATVHPISNRRADPSRTRG
jgi:hypothetical protein